MHVKSTLAGQSDGNVVADAIRRGQLERVLNVSARVSGSAFSDLLAVSVDSHDSVTCLIERVEDPARDACFKGGLEVTENSVRGLICTKFTLKRFKNTSLKRRTNTDALNGVDARSVYALLGPRTELHVNEANTTGELKRHFVDALNNVGQVVFCADRAKMFPVSVRLGCEETNEVPDLTALV